MSLIVFDFKVVEPYEVPAFADTIIVQGNSQATVSRPDGGPYGTYRNDISLDFPGEGIATGTVRTFAEWAAFNRTVQGAYDSWLWKEPLVDYLREVKLGEPDSDIGTGTGSETDFPLAHRHIDESTLNVYVDGNLNNPTNWNLIDNDTAAPFIEFVVPPPATDPVTVEYEFYYSVQFVGDPDLGTWRGSAENFRTGLIPIKEVWSGEHRAGSL